MLIAVQKTWQLNFKLLIHVLIGMIIIIIKQNTKAYLKMHIYPININSTQQNKVCKQTTIHLSLVVLKTDVNVDDVDVCLYYY